MDAPAQGLGALLSPQQEGGLVALIAYIRMPMHVYITEPKLILQGQGISNYII